MTQHDLTARIQQLTQHVLRQGADIQKEIRDVTLLALREGKLNRGTAADIIRAVVQGAQQARAASEPPPSSPFAHALRGMEEALAYSAEAMKLALQEAASRTREATLRELQRGKDDLVALEQMFIEIVTAATQGAQQSTQHTWDDFSKHMTDNTTRLRAQVQDVVTQLQQYLEQEAKQTLRKGSDTAVRVVDGLANSVADALGRLAATLRRDEAPHQK
ncbi:MAG: DUF6781 family protein [Pseudomonadota bacterium]